MSRMTSAQVIALGEYLNPDFDPAVLTVSQLLGIFGFHNIKYPAPYTKARLVQLFNEEVKPKSAKFKREKLKKQNTQASDDGISDGVTGLPLTNRLEPTRRSSRRLSRAPTRDESSPTRPEPVKRRRSSAQPSLGGPSTAKSTKSSVSRAQPMITEESEPEEEEMPVRKISRSKKTSEAAGVQARRASHIADDSGWEDNNIFQSGAESSSPMRPSPVRPHPRKSSVPKPLAPRKSRKAVSEPPQAQLSPSTSGHTDDYGSGVPQSNFEPQLPPNIRVTRAMRTSFIHQNNAAQKQIPELAEPVKQEGDETDLPDEEEQEEEEAQIDELPQGQEVIEVSSDSHEELQEHKKTVDAVSRRIAGEGEAVPYKSTKKPSTHWFLRLLTSAFVVAALGITYDFKQHSAPIGFCDTGKDTNAALEAIRSQYAAVEACNRENRTLLYLPGMGDAQALCPPPYILPHPDACTPCPKHATCSQHTVTCEPGYLVRPHPLLSLVPRPSTATSLSWAFPDKWDADFSVDYVWQALGLVMDGIPGLGPVAFPPRCLEDPKRKRHIGVLGKAVESLLGQERGRRVCAGVKPSKSEKEMTEADEAKLWGVDIDTLRDAMKRKTAPHLLETFDDTFNEAIQQLVQWGGVILGEDSNGKRYLAHQNADLTWDCVATVKARKVWEDYRRMFFMSIASVLAYLYNKSTRAKRRIEDKRVSELVQVALESLRNQELKHHTDPISAPQAFISSLQLRDLILQEEPSVTTRNRLWDQVERVVEGNANVRTNMEEVHGGDEMRVWRWVGSAGK